MAQKYKGRVLVVDDDPVICELLKHHLEIAGYSTHIVHDIASLRERITQRSYVAVLLDLYLGEDDGFEALPILAKDCPYAKVIMMSAHGTIELAVSAMEKGAASFVAKSKDPATIVKELSLRLATEETAAVSPADFGLIGDSPAIRRVADDINKMKDVDATVLIIGESGTGKELVARALHSTSCRNKSRFEAINCSAIPGGLLESELFGHKRGAFTDAKADRKGIFELCSDGTLLLDEIGEMPFEVQAKLLRVIQEKEVLPVGAGRGVPINTRVIAATNRMLVDEVRHGRFREDLYFRLAVLTIELPPLRTRKQDIPALVDHFIKKFSTRFNKTIERPSQEVWSRLAAHDWPGNVRELQNAVERGVVLTDDGKLHIEHLLQSPKLSAFEAQEQGSQDSAELFQSPLSEAKQAFEREYLKHLLEITRGNISEIARISGRYRADIYRLLSKHGVEWEEFRA